jgi:hypothetical protein
MKEPWVENFDDLSGADAVWRGVVLFEWLKTLEKQEEPWVLKTVDIELV